MRNKFIRSTIIVLAQYVLPALLLLIITPQVMNHAGQLNQTQTFFKTHQAALLLAHGLFYLILFLLWPHVIKLIISRRDHFPDSATIKTATSARWYLLAAMVLFELLIYWK